MEKKSGIRWGRVLAAALLSEVAVIAILLAVTTVHRLLSPGLTAAESLEFGARAGYYVAPAASGLATFLSVLWLARKLTSGFVPNGTLVGVAAVVLTAGFIFGARPEDRLMYIVSFVLRIVAGYLGGVVAQRMFANPALSAQQTAG